MVGIPSDLFSNTNRESNLNNGVSSNNRGNSNVTDASNVDLAGFDLVIVDPPRSGLDNKTNDYLKTINPKKIIYVPCDPVTLARDLKDLSDKYDIKDICLVNMFPRTEHVETVVKLEKGE